jgi:stalled ribosome rescue protein Dom34
MKKAIIIAMGLILTSGACFAAEQGSMIKRAKPAAAAAAETITSQTVQGAIEAIIPADAAKKTKAELSFKNDNGNVEKFLLSKLAVYDSNAKRFTLSALKAGDKAKVQYVINKDGALEARSIMLVK